MPGGSINPRGGANLNLVFFEMQKTMETAKMALWRLFGLFISIFKCKSTWQR